MFKGPEELSHRRKVRRRWWLMNKIPLQRKVKSLAVLISRAWIPQKETIMTFINPTVTTNKKITLLNKPIEFRKIIKFCRPVCSFRRIFNLRRSRKETSLSSRSLRGINPLLRGILIDKCSRLLAHSITEGSETFWKLTELGMAPSLYRIRI